MMPKGVVSWGAEAQLDDMTMGRGHRSVLVGNSLFVFGSFSRTADELWFLYIFSFDSLEWRQSPPVQRRRSHHTAILVDDKVVIYGGRISWRTTNEIIVLDLVEMEYVNVEIRGKVPRMAFHSANFVPGRDEIVIFGGETAGMVLGNTYALSLENKRFYQLETRGKSPSSRSLHASTTVGQKVFIYGGYSNEFLSDLHVLSFERGAHGTWSTVAVHGHIPCGRTFASLNYYRGWLVLYGGFHNSGGHADMFVYNLRTSNWHMVVQDSKLNPECSMEASGPWPSLFDCSGAVAADRIIFVRKGKLLQMKLDLEPP